ncbi:MAG: glutamate-5-semialdehyde dehydrogenase [Acidimicrobiaceae bacterium]|nr:glutamate-5-semialdehyde dehydrogenase [Acidimicrobiaceae bacterium]
MTVNDYYSSNDSSISNSTTSADATQITAGASADISRTSPRNPTESSSTLAKDVAKLAARAAEASAAMAIASSVAKNDAIKAAADLLAEAADELCAANALDVDRAIAEGMAPVLIDRLRLSPERVKAMANGLSKVAELRDPIGEVTDGWLRPNGLRIERVRVPLGVVAIIYESRPNVTSDAAGLCIKSGNAVFLRGSSAALCSNRTIVSIIREALATFDLPADAVVLMEDTSRAAALEFMKQHDYVDCLIPRGGQSLITSVIEHATVPVIIDGAGNCHVYVDSSADLDMAVKILVNAKTQRPSVCNAAESLLVHSAVLDEFLPNAVAALESVELVGDDRAQVVSDRIGEATQQDWLSEYLDMKISVKVVDTLSEAIIHINHNGSGHSEAIVTNDFAAAERFVREVDAAVVLVNASTRFVDGEEFGFGAEIGISTQKLHARGPMGLEQLTTRKFVVRGDGQVR